MTTITPHPPAYYRVGEHVAIVATPAAPCCEPALVGVVRVVEWREDDDDAGWWYAVALTNEQNPSAPAPTAYGGFRGAGWKFGTHGSPASLMWVQGWQLSRVQ